MLDANLTLILTAFLTTNTELECMENALRMDPSLFLILLFETRHPPVLAHHISKVFRNIVFTTTADEGDDKFFCVHGRDELATGIKMNPSC